MPVRGVGGAAEAKAAEAMTRLLGGTSGVEDDAVASAAFRFLVIGGIVPSGERNVVEAR
jgi:hypothetical protein